MELKNEKKKLKKWNIENENIKILYYISQKIRNKEKSVFLKGFALERSEISQD
jgi:hypothetical protein